MNRVLVGEPGVSAFLRSVRKNLVSHIDWIEFSNTSPIYYDPRENLKELKEKLTSFKDLLVDGEARRLGEECVDEWMDDNKHLLYDVEDILDDMKSLTNHQVRFDELYIISHGLKNGLGDILARTEVLRERAEYLRLERGTEYAFSGESKVTLRTPETSSAVDTSEVHGRQDDKKNNVMRLFEVNAKQKKKYDVHCIVGMGGSGKTTLARLVFNDPDVEKHFDVKCWVCVSNDFNVTRATKELIKNLGRGGGDQQSLAGLQRRLKATVANKKFLFVLDDVSSTNGWKILEDPFSSCANGSKILVTTKDIDVAHALGDKEPYHLQGLDHKHCMKIFGDKAFVDDEEEHEKLILGEKIVAACGGAPLVVKVIGSSLQTADLGKWRFVSEDTASWANNNDEIHPAIRFSYYHMPASLKRCLEYLAVFPHDYKFEQDDVVRLWIADGLVEEVEGRRAEDIGNEYYNELKARSLIQENNTMHDMIYNLATVLSRKFCYKENSNVPPASVRHAFLVDLNEMHFEFLAKARCLRTLIVEKADGSALQGIIRSCKMLRTLKLGDCEIYGRGLSPGERFLHHLKHMRYLTITRSRVPLLPNIDKYNLPDGTVHLSNLRFLRLGYSSISSLPHSMIGALSQLQVLDLGSNWKLKQLPEDIGNLRSLQTLDLSMTSISSLPESICALNQVQVLDLRSCHNLKQLPKDIDNLRSLRTLDLSWTSISSLPESICALNQVQVLDLGGCEDIKQLPEDIGKLGSLRTLHLSKTSITNLPESICALSQLEVLDLENCECLKELPKDIGNLWSLRKLHLKKTFISSLPETICALSQLQTLNLEECDSLKELPKDIGNLRSLRKLNLGGIYNLSVPESIRNVTGLDITY